MQFCLKISLFSSTIKSIGNDLSFDILMSLRLSLLTEGPKTIRSLKATAMFFLCCFIFRPVGKSQTRRKKAKRIDNLFPNKFLPRGQFPNRRKGNFVFSLFEERGATSSSTRCSEASLFSMPGLKRRNWPNLPNRQPKRWNPDSTRIRILKARSPMRDTKVWLGG